MTHDREADAPAYGEMCYGADSGVAKLIQPLDMDVLTAAKMRIGHLLDTFDTLAVSFSGGKDSLAVLRLVEEVYAERGIRQKVKVFFRDEELIPDAVADFVQGICASGRYDFAYYAIPLRSTKFVLGRNYDYVQFDPSRKWLRQPPPYAIRLPEGDRRVFDQYTADEFICARYRGRVAVVNGIRAQESLVRFRSCVNKKNDSYINATKCPRVKFAKPIYDWGEDDVFKYFCRRRIRYCPIYDAQTWNDEPLRVSTPLHAEAAKRFGRLKTLYPEYYEGLITLFPEMLAQARYYSSLSADAEFARYPHTFDGLLRYIDDKVTEGRVNQLARLRVVQAWGTRRTRERQGAERRDVREVHAPETEDGMTSYNGFTPAQRYRGLAIVKKAIADGVIPPANTLPCSRCGQTRGIVMYHSEDYTPERIVAQVVPLCWRCHMMLHCRFRHPKSWERYAAEVAAGRVYPPVYRHGWGILNEHFID